ncbi:hypothetical protein R3P38DRAFT_2813894 [Favolaschia claudopus]|uniref:Uncharacterized protein n=1 Tax=Favolaschia claudopus TaxID=2862362 RepID=A0AAV9Z444_9AGAR
MSDDSYEPSQDPGNFCTPDRRRYRKRQRPGLSPLTSPTNLKEESESEELAPRLSARQARGAISDLYGPEGFLNSQIGEQTYVEHLYNQSTTAEPQEQAQEIKDEEPDYGISQYDTQYSDEVHDSDHELGVQVELLRSRLDIALRERDKWEDQYNQYRRAFEEADAERSQLREDLGKWEKAAAASSALAKLMEPFSR